jgi:hypothetical protein
MPNPNCAHCGEKPTKLFHIEGRVFCDNGPEQPSCAELWQDERNKKRALPEPSAPRGKQEIKDYIARMRADKPWLKTSERKTA